MTTEMAASTTELAQSALTASSGVLVYPYKPHNLGVVWPLSLASSSRLNGEPAPF